MADFNRILEYHSSQSVVFEIVADPFFNTSFTATAELNFNVLSELVGFFVPFAVEQILVNLDFCF